ncbi:MAG: nitroreductase family protein [candidate division WOR-3 bacterium]
MGEKDLYRLLVERRSIREFLDKEVPEDTLKELFEICRWAPTARNSQSYYFIVIKSKSLIKLLSEVRTPATPIGRAPMAVAICGDPDKSSRYIEDACIAAYHFMLAAWSLGLGTCWIGGMDRNDVKEKLGIPQTHYIATITPLGWPAYIPTPPPRKPAEDFYRIIE